MNFAKFLRAHFLQNEIVFNAKFSRTPFFNRTPPVTASEDCEKVVITWNTWSSKVGFVTV